ncbi:hypothetical protein HN011_002446 [Eciton burchellii]|nr:hypothetical protein HN011_002446 [Eciton burchellii]
MHGSGLNESPSAETGATEDDIAVIGQSRSETTSNTQEQETRMHHSTTTSAQSLRDDLGDNVTVHFIIPSLLFPIKRASIDPSYVFVRVSVSYETRKTSIEGDRSRLGQPPHETNVVPDRVPFYLGLYLLPFALNTRSSDTSTTFNRHDDIQRDTSHACFLPCI